MGNIYMTSSVATKKTKEKAGISYRAKLRFRTMNKLLMVVE